MTMTSSRPKCGQGKARHLRCSGCHRDTGRSQLWSLMVVNTVLQLCASRRWAARVKDVKTAFLQSRPTSRKTPLVCRQPRDEPLPGLDPRQLIMLLTEIYGLVSGPSWWRSSFLQRTGRLGYKVCPYEPCVLVLPNEKTDSSTQGVMVIEVDDIIEGGDERHRQLMDTLEGEVTFGKVVNLQEKESSCAGKSLKQLADFSFESHMDEYVYTRMSPVVMSRKVLKKDACNSPLDDNEKSELRGVLATLTWVGREGRPDAAAAASVLASAFPEPSVDTIYQANEMIRQLKQHPVRLRIHSISGGEDPQPADFRCCLRHLGPREVPTRLLAGLHEQRAQLRCQGPRSA